MDQLFLVGRLIFGGFFLYNGVNHFVNQGMLAGYAAGKGLPVPELAIIVSGLVLIFGGLSILLGCWVRLGVASIVLFLVAVSPTMHNYWAIDDPAQRMADQINFFKNMALLGGALAFLAVPLPWPYSLTHRYRHPIERPAH